MHFFSFKAWNMDIIGAEKYTTEAEVKFAAERRLTSLKIVSNNANTDEFTLRV
jgi:hypothetical protein